MGEDNKYIIYKHLQTPWNFHEDKKNIKQRQATMLKKNKKLRHRGMGGERKNFQKKIFGKAASVAVGVAVGVGGCIEN